MNIRSLILPAALVAGLGFACAPQAQASPVPSARVTSAAFGGIRIGGGVGVGFPIGGPRYSNYHPGYWTTQNVQVMVPVQVTVQVPDHVIGTDVNGNPIWTYRTEVRTQYQAQWVTQQVWVPGHYHNQSHGRGYVGLGVRFR